MCKFTLTKGAIRITEFIVYYFETVNIHGMTFYTRTDIPLEQSFANSRMRNSRLLPLHN